MTPDEFLAAVRYFGEPKIPDGVAPSVILGAYTEGLERYPADVLALAAKRMLESRKHLNFPLPEECTRYCSEASEEIEIRCQRNGEGLAAISSRKDDPWTPGRIRAADGMMDSDIGRLAATEGWIIHLHDFCREQGRLPNHLESERVRREGLEVKADREELARLGGPTNRIVLAGGRSLEAKRNRLSGLAYRRTA